ncbi:MAG: hypothetical protein AAB903_03290 [Patescibacteria group bacterium]
MEETNPLPKLSLYILGSIFVLTLFAIAQTVFGAGGTVNVSSLVVVGNSAPTVSNVVLNGGSLITLITNATTAITVGYTVTDANGCNDVFQSGSVTSTVFRSGVGAACTANNANCYILHTTTTNACTGNASTTNATTTFGLYYFADSTNGASSSYAAQYWEASVLLADASSATSTASSTNQELDVLNAIDITTSSINYGTVSANANTGGTNQYATTTNAGNSSTTVRVHAISTLTSGANSMATSSQVYSTSSFTYAGTSTALTDTAVTISGLLMTAPTSTATTTYARTTFWGLGVPPSTATGSYTGTTRFTSLWQP